MGSGVEKGVWRSGLGVRQKLGCCVSMDMGLGDGDGLARWILFFVDDDDSVSQVCGGF